MVKVQTYRSIKHRDVVHIDILNDVNLILVLAERANRNAVGAIAVKVLNEDIGAVRLERDTVCVGLQVRIVEV